MNQKGLIEPFAIRGLSSAGSGPGITRNENLILLSFFWKGKM